MNFAIVESMANSKVPRSTEVPVTQKMLYGVRDQLQSEIRALDHSFGSKFEKLSSDIQQMRILMDEQDARNRVVLDGLGSLFDRQERVERSVEDIQKVILGSK